MAQREKRRDKTSLSNSREILLVMNYCLGYMYVYPNAAAYISLLVNPYTSRLLPGLDFMIYIFMIVFSIFVSWPLLKGEYVILKDEIQDTTQKVYICLKNLLYIYLGNFLLGSIIQWLARSQSSANQSSLAQAAQSSPLIIIFTSLIFAPIVEEIVFRGSIFRFMRIKYSFMSAAIISSLLFGFIHVYVSLFTGNYYDLWYIFLYAIPGFFIAKTYEETNTIYGAIFLHFINNAIGLLFLF